MPQRKAKLFKNGRSQAVRIPREFEFQAREVTIRREGQTLILEPVHDDLFDWLAMQPDIEEEFPEIDDPPPTPVDLGF